MSGDDHGHSSGHGHDSHDGPTDIIPLGSLQDRLLGLICLLALLGLCLWGQGFRTIAAAHQGESVPEHHAGTAAAE